MAEVGALEAISLMYSEDLGDGQIYGSVRVVNPFSSKPPPGMEVRRSACVRERPVAERMLARESQGVVYPSVRRAGGTCLACFRPAQVGSVRKATTYRFR